MAIFGPPFLSAVVACSAEAAAKAGLTKADYGGLLYGCEHNFYDWYNTNCTYLLR